MIHRGEEHLRSTGLPSLALGASLLLATAAGALAGDLRAEASHPPMVLAKSYGPSFPTMEGPARETNGEMAFITKRSLGCLGLGTAATLAVIGSSVVENAIHVIGGGVVAAANPTVTFLAVGGVVFASFCAVGHAMTPLVVHYFNPPEPVAAPPAQPSSCRNCRDARPLPSTTEPAGLMPAALSTVSPPAPGRRAGGPTSINGLATLRAAIR